VSARIDHAEKARMELDFLHEWMSEEGQTDATQLASVLEAQVHATLALADEQRIANLIAFAAEKGETAVGNAARRQAGVALGLYPEADQ
jgi:hypothetical protein